jgi:hypothetical protein
MNKKLKDAIVGAICLFVVSLLIIEYLPEIYVYLREGFAFRSWTQWMYADTAFVALWMIIIIRSAALWLYKNWAVKKDIFKVSIAIDKRSAIILAVMACVMLPGAFLVPHTFSLIAHYNTRVGLWGSTWGLLNTISQYIYYIVEGVKIVFMLDVFQTMGELWTPKKFIPWGGIGLALTWGVLHYFTKGTTQLIAHSVLSLVMGMSYVVCKRNLWPPFLLWMAGVSL